MTHNPYGVRRATPDDIELLRLFVPDVLKETTPLPLSDAKVSELIERCCYQRSGAIAGIIDGPEGNIDASVGLAFVESETSDVPYISAVWCGLHPSIHTRAAREKRDPQAPREHYGRRLFEFAKWCHSNLEAAAGHPIMMRFDLLTFENLAPKMGLFQRNLMQIGGSFAFGISGPFKPQPVMDQVAA